LALITNIFLAEDNAVFHRHFNSDPFVVASLIEDMTEQFAGFALPRDVVATIEILLCEVINNINEHAYAGAPDGPIEIRAEVELYGITFLLVDCGSQMPGDTLPAGKVHDLSVARQDLPEGGFGWSLIRDLAQGLKYVRKAGENHLSFRVTIGRPLAEI